MTQSKATRSIIDTHRHIFGPKLRQKFVENIGFADDLLEGRGAGTRGHEIAARFIAARFEADGLEPAGDNGIYFQFVPLRSFRPDEKHTSLTLIRNLQTVVTAQSLTALP